MKKNIFIIILVLLVIGLGGYLIYDKIIDDDSNNKISDVEDKEETKNNLLNLNNLKEFKNFDSSYGNQQSYSFEFSNSDTNEIYTVQVVLDGSVRICKGYTQECNNIDNIKDVVDSKEFLSSSLDNPSTYYFLTNNGDVYYYESSNTINKNYKAVKLTDVSNVNKLLYINYYPIQQSGGRNVLIAITNDDNYVILNSETA